MVGLRAHALPAMFAVLLALDAPPVTDAAMRSATDRLAAEVGAVRGIRPRGTLERHLVSRAEARAGVEATVTAALAGADMASEERVLQRLGLIRPRGDYARLLADAYGDSPSARYDAGTHRLYVPDWIPLERQRVVLAHELAHALADQRFGLRRLLQIDAEGRHALDHDAELARQAVIEGDATTAALELVDGRAGFLGPREIFAHAERMRAVATGAGKWEPWIRAAALFTQVDGFQLVARARARQSWAGVDELWAAPPASTEQVLHPEKYDAREPPIAVDAAAFPPLGPELRPTGSLVLGELGVRIWLESAVAPEVAARAAAGWGGDRAVLYASPLAPEAGRDGGAPPEPALAWLTVWDDPVDADDFARVAAVALAKLSGEPPAALDEGGRAVLHGASGLYAVARRGGAVALLVGAPADAEPALERMLDAVAPKKTDKPRPGKRRRG